jgi:hypothetical protein
VNHEPILEFTMDFSLCCSVENGLRGEILDILQPIVFSDRHRGCIAVRIFAIPYLRISTFDINLDMTLMNQGLDQSTGQRRRELWVLVWV